MLDLSKLTGITNIDKDRFLVTAGPRTTIAEFGEPLWAQGLSLSNQGDIDAQAIAGAIATATHGSGRRFPNFSAVLERARVVDGSGNALEVSRNQNADLLPAIQTSIGVLGIMTEVTIKVAPAYIFHARTDIMNLDEVMERFDSDVEEYRHFGLFWMPTDQSVRLYNLDGAGADECVVKRYREFGVDDAPPALGPHQRFGPAHQIYPMVYDPNFHEVEYFLPLEHAREILDEMRRLMMRWLPLSIYPLEIRVVAHGMRHGWSELSEGQPGRFGFRRAGQGLLAVPSSL